MYRVNIIDSLGEWQQQFNSLEEAQEFAKIKEAMPDVEEVRLLDGTQSHKDQK